MKIKRVNNRSDMIDICEFLTELNLTLVITATYRGNDKQCYCAVLEDRFGSNVTIIIDNGMRDWLTVTGDTELAATKELAKVMSNKTLWVGNRFPWSVKVPTLWFDAE